MLLYKIERSDRNNLMRQAATTKFLGNKDKGMIRPKKGSPT